MVKMDFFPKPNKELIPLKIALNGVISKTYSNDNPKRNFKLLASKRILDPNTISHTIVKRINACGINPLTNKYFSIEELKVLSSFPSSFNFIVPISSQANLIGNAVSPKFIEAIATKTIREEILT
jgi:site-specific DNA-cytosine methylase